MCVEKKDTRIPIEFIPLIISHWWDEYYYGPGFTITELRKFLESKLHAGFYTEEAVNAWIHRAVGWKKHLDLKCPGYADSILEEYTFLRHVA